MMKQSLIFLLMLFIASSLFSQKKYTISGYVEDASSGEKLIAANVFNTSSAQGAVSNTYGFYSLTLEKDSVFLEISYIGYQPIMRKFFLNKDVHINFKLEPAIELTTIEVTAEKYERIEQETQMSKIDIPIEQIKKVPALFGEVDVIKTLQLLPGVQSGGEGQDGLYVRGGSPDQNLILLDGVPVYNVSHLLGIFSVFNADAIKTVTLTKGGFPARYGGRLSSVSEINMKDGDMNKFKGEGSIGLISSKLALQGPILKGKTSFLVSARRTYADLIFRPIFRAAERKYSEDTKTKVALYFYDINAKINHKFNEKHRLFLSFYSGSDIFKLKVKDYWSGNEDIYGGGINWGNFITALRWNYKINNKLFANSTLTYSNYDLNIGAEYEEHWDNQKSKFSALYLSGIKDFAQKVDFDFIPTPNHYIRFGGSATHHTYKPGAISIKVEEADYNLDTLIGHNNDYSMEYDMYVEDDMKFGAFKANIGLHASGFATDGVFYKSLQPRINLRYLINNDIAIKASYATMAQYLNLLTSEALSLPSDLWVPSTKTIKPQESWQAAFGLAKTFKKEYEVSIEGYYKEMKNVISYLPGENFLTELDNGNFGDTEWETKITQGTGQSYGVELFLQKKKGNTTGWIGYTLSWNWRQFDNVNGGKRYPYRYDRRHDISIVLSHKFNDRISTSATWVFGTGNAITLPVFKYQQPGQNDWYYFFGQEYIESTGNKNDFRMSSYHRLDLGIEFHKDKKWGERTWVIGVYNAYWHSNPYFILRHNKYNYHTGERESKFSEISVLPFIPSISYVFKFDFADLNKKFGLIE